MTKWYNTKYGAVNKCLLFLLTETNLTYKEIVETINVSERKICDFVKKQNISRNKPKYHIDHIYSIKEGFKNAIIPELIGHSSNLRIIKWEDNLKKYTTCDITINDLIYNASVFLTNNNKIII